MSAGPTWDATLTEVRDHPGADGVPPDAHWYRTPDLEVARWAPPGGLHTGTTCLVRTPVGLGWAWSMLPFSQAAMQFGGVQARIGDDEVLLRRNGPRPLLRQRVVHVEGAGVQWEVRVRGTATTVRDAATDGLLFTDRDGPRVTATCTPHQAALLVLLHAESIAASMSGLRWIGAI